MKYQSVFDIIGPVMVGPSSSHTAGAVRIGLLARKLFGREPERVTIHFYGSFAKTYKGHATDVATLAGLMGLSTFDEGIPKAFDIANDKGIKYSFIEESAIPKHPNTIVIDMYAGDKFSSVKGISLGGGLVEICEVDGFALKLSGESPALLIFHIDTYGTIASVTTLLAEKKINISHMEVSRLEKGRLALMVIETDQSVPDDIFSAILAKPNIERVVRLNL